MIRLIVAIALLAHPAIDEVLAADDAPLLMASSQLSAIDVFVEAQGLVVMLAGDGSLAPGAVREAGEWVPRLVVDLPEALTWLPESTRVGVWPVERIRVEVRSVDPPESRVVFDLQAPAAYWVELAGPDVSGLRVVFPPEPQEASPVRLSFDRLPSAPPGGRWMSALAVTYAVPDSGVAVDDVSGAMPASGLLTDPSAPTRGRAVRTRWPSRLTRPGARRSRAPHARLRQPTDDVTLRAWSETAAGLGVLLDDETPPLWRDRIPLAFGVGAAGRVGVSIGVEPASAWRTRVLTSPVPLTGFIVAPVPGLRAVSDLDRLEHDAPRINRPDNSQTSFLARASSRIPSRPSPRIGQAAPSAQAFTGEPISLDFQNADLRGVLRLFGEISGLNIVIDPQVTGAVDVNFTAVPWDQALDIILRSNQLDYEIDGNVIRIAPISVFTQEATQRRELVDEQALLGELVLLVKTLSYARAEAMAELITESVLSPRGDVQFDPRTNTLIVRDLADRLTTAEDLLERLDRAEPQVEIEARIVQAGREFARSLGVQWGITGRVAPDLGNTTPLTFPNRGGVSGRAGGTQGPAASGADVRAGGTEDVGTAVNLRAPGATSALGVTLGSVDGALNLDVVLSAAENDGTLRLLSHPRITTQNNVPASITQGEQIPIQTVSNNTVTVTFEDAALSLQVTPQITAENTVIMQIEIQNDFADFAQQINGIPPINTQRASTTVQVADGDTTVIGGIFESERSSSTNGVPGLSRIPLLGWLFRSQTKRESTDELLIFLTPRIVR